MFLAYNACFSRPKFFFFFFLAMPSGMWGFLGSSAGKESTCNAGDPSSVPGSGRSPGKEIGYLLQCSWASLVTHMVKNLPAMQEIPVRFLGGENPMEKG